MSSTTPVLRTSMLAVFGTLSAGGSDALPNRVELDGAAMGTGPSVAAAGPDAAIPLLLAAKAEAPVRMVSNGARVAEFTGPSNAVNALSIVSAGTGQAVAIRTIGDTNCGIIIAPGGTASVTVTGPASFTGAVTLPGSPTEPNHAATRAYVDQVATTASGIDLSDYVTKVGSVMTGPLALSGAPTEPAHATTKAYVDDAILTASSAGFVRRFTFMVNFTGSDPTSFSGIPNGWSITVQGVGVIRVVHNVGSLPLGAMVWGRTSNGTTWTQRAVGTSALNLSYTRTVTNTFDLNGVSTTNVGAGGSQQAEFVILFSA